MSNKYALATIQFRADAKGANVALETLQSKAADARRTVNDLEDAMKHGIKTMKDANGVEFDVAAKFHNAEKEARSFEKAVRELIKGATALETVVGNIRLGEIEKSSRAELKGAINAAEARKRSVRETDPEDLQQQRELNKVIEESRKQLNRLDRDTAKVIETLQKGGTVADAVLNKEIKGLQEILTMIPKGTKEWKAYNDQLKQMEGFKATAQIRELEQSSKLLGSSNLGRYSEEKIRAAISAGKELLATYKTGSKEAKALSAQIANAEAHLKTHGLEAARAAQRQAEATKLLDDKYKMMQSRMNNLSKLSQSALEETQKYWEAQRDGATRGSKAYKEAEANLKKITAEQERLNKIQLEASAKKLNTKNFGTMSEAELRKSVNAAKELMASLKPTDPAFKQLQDNILRAEEYMQKFGLDAERSARKVAQQLQTMTDRMSNLGKLSDGAIEETKRFWQAQMDGAERGSKAYKDAENHIKTLTAEQRKLADERAKVGADKLKTGNLMTMSERDIRQAIEDAKKYQQSLSASEQEYKDLSVAIANAEDHIKKFGLEAERASRKEIEAQRKADQERAKSIQMMEDQLRQGTSLTQTALKAQEQYWQRMIDDPKNAGKSLTQYEQNLRKVKRLQEQMVQKEGTNALSFFRGDTSNASANQLKEQAEALKRYRDSLPQKANAKLIEEINGYLVKTGQSAKKAADDIMSLADAEALVGQIGTKGFAASTTDLNRAKKALIEEQKLVGRGTAEFTRLQEEINKVNLELAKTGQLGKEVQNVLNAPKGKSFNELKIAVEQGRAALNSMRTETDADKKKFDELAAKVKECDFQMKQLGGSAKGSATAFEKAWSRLKTYITLYVGAAMAMQKIASTMGDLMELSDKMGEVRKTTGFEADEVGRLAENLKKLDVRTDLTSLMEVAAKAGQLGLKTEQDVLGFTEAANKMMIALPEMGADAATQLLKVALATGEIDKIRKQIQEGTIEGTSAVAVAMEKVGSTIDQLRANSAATAPAITDFVKRVGAVGAQSGITIDQVAALGSTVDALGMRVEMSATALSRMIPAIKNNAFDIAKVIGVTPNTIRELFDAGRGMEVILMILQHIKDSGKDVNSIEAMLGMGNMKEIMKELNQQGARAGIVFAGLSQNVDELRRQLGVASEAYEENMAIQREFDKMNDTTAAKWERFKNQFEEMFIGDSAQKNLGVIIDFLSKILYLISNPDGIGPWLRTILAYMLLIKVQVAALAKGAIVALWKGIKNIGIALGFVRGEMTKLQLSNIFTAAALALGYLILNLKIFSKEAKAASTAVGQLEEQFNKETNTVNKLFRMLAKAREQERRAAEIAEETAKAEAKKTKAAEQEANATEDYMKKLSLIDMLEKQRVETEKFLMDNLTKKTKATKAATKAEEENAAAGEKTKKQSELITMMEERRASIMDFLTQQHEREVVVIGDRTKAIKKLQKQNELINQLEAQRADIMEFLNQKHLQEVVVIGDRTKSLKKLWAQNDLIAQLEEHRAGILDFLTGKQEKEVKVIESRGKAVKDLEAQGILIEQLEQRRIGMMEFLNQKYLQEVVVIGDRTKAMKNLQQQSELITQLEQQRAETMDFLMQKHVQDVVVTGDRMKSLKKLWAQNDLITRLEERRAEIQEFLNQKNLQEIVVTGDRTKSLKKMWEQNELITQLEERRAQVLEFLNQRQLQEIVITGQRSKVIKNLQLQTNLISQLEERRKNLMDFMYQKQLQEIVVTGERTKALKNLQQQNELIIQLDERNASVMDFLTSKHLQEVVVIGKRSKAIEKMQEQNELINQLEERRADIIDFLTQKHVQEIVVTGNRTKALENLRQQNLLINQLEEQQASILNFLTTQHEKEVVATEKQKKAEKELGQQSALVMMLEKQQAEMTDFLSIKTGKLSEETEKLANDEEKVAKETESVAKARFRVNLEGSKSVAIIREINSKYGKYLGYMLSETTSAQQLAAARELINKKLRETIALKQKEAGMGEINSTLGQTVNKEAAETDKLIEEYFGDNAEVYARVSVAVSEAAQKFANDSKKFQEAVQNIIMVNKKFISKDRKTELMAEAGIGGLFVDDETANANVASNIATRAENYRKSIQEYQKEVDVLNRTADARQNALRKESRDAALATIDNILADYKELKDRFTKAVGDEKVKLATALYKQQRSYANAVANNAEYFEGSANAGIMERNIENMKTYEKGLRKVADAELRAVDAAELAQSKIEGVDFTNFLDPDKKEPWGGGVPGESTAYKDMTAEALVNRRKQMKDFVNAIQTDTDVKAVLAEDKALKKAIEGGMASDMRTVIEWYNTERLKIQDELHERHLTNTGDWLDPKKTKARRKQLNDELKAFLDELDAYYIERKSKIQQAQADEGMSEAEAERLTIENETIWRQRRMELQKLYADKSSEVEKSEQDAIYNIIAERTEDSADMIEKFIKKTVKFAKQLRNTNEQGAKDYRAFMGRLEKGISQDFLKQQNAIAKQINTIRDIINKERPFNGITENLQNNLSTMGLLFTELDKKRQEAIKAGKEPEDDTALRSQEEQLKRLMLLMGEVDHAYQLTFDDLAKKMKEAGLKDWADAIASDDQMKQAIMAALHNAFDAVQEAIKKEASIIKKQVDIMWNDTLMPDGSSFKQTYEAAISKLGLQEDQVSRANSLINAGASSERVADKLAIKQLQVRLAMQQHYYNLIKAKGLERIKKLEDEAELYEKQGKLQDAELKRMDAKHAKQAMALSDAEEQTKIMEQQNAITNKIEESQNRLYKELREWADLLTSSMQSLMEATHAGDAEYYNERAKLNLTGKGGPGAGTYIVIDNEGTSDAKAHYEYLDERQALERQHEIERQNAQAEAWKKVMDDINQKMSDQITDLINATLQNASIDINTNALNIETEATRLNTEATKELTQKIDEVASGKKTTDNATTTPTDSRIDYANSLASTQTPDGGALAGDAGRWAGNMMGTTPQTESESRIDFANSMMGQEQVQTPVITPSDNAGQWASNMMGIEMYQQLADSSSKAAQTMKTNNDKIAKSTKSSFAAMTAAANMYGIAYQTMANDNLSTTQKVEMMIVQAAGQAAISMLTASMAASTGETAANAPSWISKTLKELGPIGGPVAVGVFTALIGGLMGLATSKIAKSKSQIAQVTGASVGAGRLSTGMLTYKEGNVNEFSDPASLTPGRSYNVDAADGKTYRAKYTGKNPSTHLTNGPEFHLAGEKGREMIIDAGTTRQITMNDNEIWQAIKTLSGGGRVQSRRSMRRGVRAFAEGNVDDFETVDSGAAADELGFDPTAMQASLDKNNELLERALTNGIKGVFNVYGKDGLIDSYDTGKKNVTRHGERY